MSSSREQLLKQITIAKKDLDDARHPEWSPIESYPSDPPLKIFMVSLLVDEVEIPDCYVHPITGLWTQYKDTQIKQELITHWRPRNTCI
jgi:hypothetical protein